MFTSDAKNLTATQDDSNGATDVFLYSLCGTPDITLVSHQEGKPDQAATDRSDQPVISPDGRFVVFRSTATDIVPGAGYGAKRNIFLWDRTPDTFTLVSHAFTGPQQAGNGDSLNAVINRNPAGRPVRRVRECGEKPSVGGHERRVRCIPFRVPTGAIDLVSVPNDCGSAGQRGSFHPDIDATGDCIVYESLATNLVSGKPGDDANNALDVFRWKFAAEPAVTLLVSHLAGAPSFGAARSPATVNRASRRSTTPASDSRSRARSRIWPPIRATTTAATTCSCTESARRCRAREPRGRIARQDRRRGEPLPILSRDGRMGGLRQRGHGSRSRPDRHARHVRRVPLRRDGRQDPAREPRGQGRQGRRRGESVLPEISVDGQYVAYESAAKDLDPNQNDGNGDLDVFIYNRSGTTRSWPADATPRSRSPVSAGATDPRSAATGTSWPSRARRTTSSPTTPTRPASPTCSCSGRSSLHSRSSPPARRPTPTSIEWVTPASQLPLDADVLHYGHACPFSTLRHRLPTSSLPGAHGETRGHSSHTRGSLRTLRTATRSSLQHETAQASWQATPPGPREPLIPSRTPAGASNGR